MEKDIILIVIGAIIGFVSSMGMLVIERIFEREGKIKIYYKFISTKSDQRPWGIRKYETNMLSMVIPLVFEIQNTSNITRVIRDVNVEMFKEKEFVGKMIQIEYEEDRKNIEKTSYGDEDNSYSFVLNPRSIKRYRCLFTYHIDTNNINEKDFDKLYISYYDENDNKIKLIAKKNLDGWRTNNLLPDRDWILLK